MNQYTKRMIVFFSIIFLVESVLALWVGMGWFLLAETLRRALVAIPRVYFSLLAYLQGSARAAEEMKYYSDGKYRWRYVLRFVLLSAWIFTTILAFNRFNFSLVELFTNSR